MIQGEEGNLEWDGIGTCETRCMDWCWRSSSDVKTKCWIDDLVEAIVWMLWAAIQQALRPPFKTTVAIGTLGTQKGVGNGRD